MGKSLAVGSVAGVGVRVHWSFGLLMAWVVASQIFRGATFAETLLSLIFLLLVFSCVVLHEFGHAIAARCFGIATRDITISPIGGMARLERIPQQPAHEIAIALAGPAVNTVIACLLLTVITPATGIANLSQIPAGSGYLLQQLLFVNVAMVALNLLPAFPMDGGRVLRALLTTMTGHPSATRCAARAGQVMAVALGVLSMLNPFVLILAAFIFWAASSEARQVTVREHFRRRRVRDAMISRLSTVSPDHSAHQTARRLVADAQRDFPVVADNAVVGMFRYENILQVLQTPDERTVEEMMDRDTKILEADAELLTALEASVGRKQTLPVTRNGALVGMLDPGRVDELLEARAQLNARSSLTETSDTAENVLLPSAN